MIRPGSSTTPPRPKAKTTPRRQGFTLVELLVVISIVILVSAVTLPTIIPALQNRQVSEGARILQGALAGARDAAIRANAPRGIRLLPDPTSGVSGMVFCNRILSIEPAPDHTDGLVTFPGPIQPAPLNNHAIPWIWTNASGLAPAYPNPPAGYNYPRHPAGVNPSTGQVDGVLMITQAVFSNVPEYTVSTQTTAWPTGTVPIPAPPTNWFWNIRIGDRIRFNDSGSLYTVVGPMTVSNPENFVNDGVPAGYMPLGNPASSSLQMTYPPVGSGGPIVTHPEFLFLVNQIDDNSNGFTDEAFDGLNNDLNYSAGVSLVDDIGEWNGVTTGSGPEVEAWKGTQRIQSAQAVPPVVPYTILRRPVPSPGARETPLPAACVIDLTTYDTSRERSRLPDPVFGSVDVLINQSGQVMPTTLYSTPSAFPMDGAFFHFWVSDRTDLYTPSNTFTSTDSAARLPMPDQGGGLYPYINPTTGQNVGLNPANFNPGLTNKFLKRDRQLVTLYTRTGQVVTNAIENFDAANLSRPYTEAQLGIREAK